MDKALDLSWILPPRGFVQYLEGAGFLTFLDKVMGR